MFGTLIGPFSILIIRAFSVTVLQPSQGSVALADTSAVQSQPLILANASSNGTVSGNDLAITCDYKLGSGLRVTSCQNIFPLLRQGNEQYIFADRTSTVHFEIGLPFRVQGLDGTCYIEILLVPGKAYGQMSLSQFGQAAFTLFDVCVKHYGYGGVAANVGGDNNLQITIGRLRPSVICKKRTPGPAWTSCSDILATMDVSKENVTFGRRAGPGVEKTLPIYLQSYDTKCLVKIDSTTQATSISSWYEIWQGINSIAYMCVRQTVLGGQASKLGSRKTITIEISAHEAGVGLSNATLLNASSGQEDLLLLPAGAQNFSSEGASSTPPSPLVPYVM